MKSSFFVIIWAHTALSFQPWMTRRHCPSFLHMSFLSMPPSSSLLIAHRSHDPATTAAESPVLLPPLTQDLFTKVTENYVFGVNRHPIDFLDVLRVTEEFRFQPTLVTIGPHTFGTTDDEGVLVSELFSLAALGGLGKELTLQLLSVVPESRSWGLAKRAFREQGWDAVNFPKGLALRKREGIRKRFRRNRVKEAERAVQACRASRPPQRRLESREELRKELVAQFSEQANVSMRKENLSYFPQYSALSWRSLKRKVDGLGKTLKDKGRAGIVAYALFNFVLYSVGVVYQWKRIAPGDPLSGSSVATLCLRKLGRVFASMYVVSNILKIPKIMISIAMTPMTKRGLDTVKYRLGVSENVATIVLVTLLLGAWAGIVAFPVISEYQRLTQLVHLEGAVLNSAIHSV